MKVDVVNLVGLSGEARGEEVGDLARLDLAGLLAQQVEPNKGSRAGCSTFAIPRRWIFATWSRGRTGQLR